MAPLLCLPPNLLDQSFPRDEEELRSVAEALGRIVAELQAERVHLLVSDVLAEFVGSFDWNPPRPYALLNDIYRLACQLILQPHPAVERLDLTSVEEFRPHPLPVGTSNLGLVEFWADEVG